MRERSKKLEECLWVWVDVLARRWLVVLGSGLLAFWRGRRVYDMDIEWEYGKMI